MIPIDIEKTAYEEGLDHKGGIDCNEENHITLHNINTFMAHKNELCLRGIDENGNDLTIWFDSYEFLSWIDKEHIKETLIKYIKKI
jgi:hypothetical protein